MMKKTIKRAIAIALFMCGVLPSLAQTTYSEWMATSEVARQDYAAPTSGPSDLKNQKRNKTQWRYDTGLMWEAIMDAGRKAQNQTVLDAVESYVTTQIDGKNTFIVAKGGTSVKINNRSYDPTTLDDIRPGKLLWRYYKYYGGDDLKTACQTLFTNILAMDRLASSDASNTTNYGMPWFHKASYANQVWLDGIFMGLPFYTLVADELGSEELKWYIDDAVSQIDVTDDKTYDSSKGLWMHAYDNADEKIFWTDYQQMYTQDNVTAGRVTKNDSYALYKHGESDWNGGGRSAHSWGRAMGWYAMALVEVMENINALNTDGAYDSQLASLKATFKKVMKAVVDKQQPNGVWYDVLDVDDYTKNYPNVAATNFYDKEGNPTTATGNYYEATCSAMFAYALLRGYNDGFFDGDAANKAAMLEAGKKAYCGIVKEFIKKDGNGNIDLTNCVAVSGLGDEEKPWRDGSFEYYMSEPVVYNDCKGVGPFIWASLAAEELDYDMDSNSFNGVATPTISSSEGTSFDGLSTTVTITAGDGATIYYTTDGSEPTTSATQYTEPFAIYATTTVKAIAVVNGESSSVATATFTNKKENVFTAAQSGSYKEGETVVLKNEDGFTNSSSPSNPKTIAYSFTKTSGDYTASASGTGGGTANDSRLKYNKTVTLTLPNDIKVKSITFSGKANKDDGSITTINGNSVDGFDYTASTTVDKTYTFTNVVSGSITFVCSKQLELIITIVTAGESTDATPATLVLYEDATEGVPAEALGKTGVTVTVNRALTAGKWNAMCVPFAVTSGLFDGGAELETLQGVTDDGTFQFRAATKVEAGVPFIIKPTKNFASPMVFEGMTISSDADATAVAYGGYSYVGSYPKVWLRNDGTQLYLSMSLQQLTIPGGSQMIKGLRGYFEKPASQGKVLISFDSVADRIEHVTTDEAATATYNLQGQRVASNYKGIVIRGGRKMLAK